MFFLLKYLKTNARMHELELEQQKTQLGALKMQLEPHFLFNTLNVFYTELVETQPATAKGIHRLSELLRYLTYEGQNDFTPLRKELKFIEDYVYLHQKRFEHNLYLDFSIEGEINDKEIPSLILIHFIENIFKHGVINDKQYPAEVTIIVTDDFLELKTMNRISEVKNYSDSGLGRQNLEKRLQLLYDTNYTFIHEDKANYYRTFLRLPL